MDLADEEWRPIPGWEGYYEASSLGRIRSVERIVRSVAGVSWRQPGKVLKRSRHRDGDGRGIVRLCREGRTEAHRIAPLILTTFVSPRPKGLNACHCDGNPANDRLDNLRWDTQSNNLRDAVRHGTNRRARRTHCPRDHVLAEPNLVPSEATRGHRKCLACDRASAAVRSARRAGRTMDFHAVAAARYAQIVGRH